jgi:hypothetical protein
MIYWLKNFQIEIESKNLDKKCEKKDNHEYTQKNNKKRVSVIVYLKTKLYDYSVSLFEDTWLDSQTHIFLSLIRKLTRLSI